MRKAVISACLALFLTIAVLCAPMTVVYAQGITLNPDSGFSVITISGAGFSPGYSVNITWDGSVIPTYPDNLQVDAWGDFVAMITVPTQTSPGVHTVQAIASPAVGGPSENATAQFNVEDMTGPAGPPGENLMGAVEVVGPAGPPGPSGPAGPPGPSGGSGSAGATGPMPAHEWSETSLRLEDTDSSTGWGEYVDLQGPQGEQGIPGEQGPQGEQGPRGEAGLTGGLSIAAIVMALGALGWTLIGAIKRFVGA